MASETSKFQIAEPARNSNRSPSFFTTRTDARALGFVIAWVFTLALTDSGGCTYHVFAWRRK